jgi:hypothetical protein
MRLEYVALKRLAPIHFFLEELTFNLTVGDKHVLRARNIVDAYTDFRNGGLILHTYAYL